MSGLIIPVVASRRPIRRLLFIHTVLPQPESSLADQLASEPDMFNPEMMTVPPNWWSDEAIVTRFLFHDCSPDVAHNAFLQLRPPEGGVLIPVSCPAGRLAPRPRRSGGRRNTVGES
jgi:hypothetical protein